MSPGNALAPPDCMSVGRPSTVSLDCKGADLKTMGAHLVPGYDIGERIGSGGMADVYRARHIGLDRVVAIKWPKEWLVEDAEFVERFLREARLCARLRH